MFRGGGNSCGLTLSGSPPPPLWRYRAAIAANPLAAPGDGDGPLAPFGECGEPSRRPNNGLGCLSPRNSFFRGRVFSEPTPKLLA
ncbi:hypothetical protein BE221DRAFT_207688 [Ostreococcus tauri]|uniref:Uncharacterized protein n=1 Tax=Ostreococcus tauri TaxID=70448 RepID=A0A1Y5I170_OSTTA|nr:hypothetical protein BE221DRAFT_207688 [Ostreococcus tauri]